MLVLRVWFEGDDPRPRARITERLDVGSQGQETVSTHTAEEILAAVADWLARFNARATPEQGDLNI